MRQIRTEDITERFLPDHKLGYEFKYGGALVKVVKRWDDRRYVFYNESSYIGAIGAEHFYGKLRPQTSEVEVLRGDKKGYHKKGDTFSSSGPEWPSDLDPPEIELTRLVVREERKMSMLAGEIVRKPGEHTNGFLHVRDVRAEAVRVFEEFFGDGWVLTASQRQKGKDYWEDLEVVGFEEWVAAGDEEEDAHGVKLR